MHGTQVCYGEHVELTVDDIWQIADVGDQELRRLAHSSWRGTLELGVEDNKMDNYSIAFFHQLTKYLSKAS